MKPLCWLTISSILLSACANFRGMPPLDVKLPEFFAQAPATQTPAKLSQDWWKSTNDETLKSMIVLLETENLSLEQARFRLHGARQSELSLDYLPTLSTTTDAQYNRLIKGDFAINNMGFGGGGGGGSGQQKTTGFYNARIDSSWELPLWGTYGATSNIDDAVEDYAQADLEAVRANVIAETIRLYGEMRGFQQQRLRQEEIFTANRKIADYQTIKLKAGLIADREVTSANRANLDVATSLQTTQKNETAAMHQLCTLLGRTELDSAWKTPADIPTFTFPELSDAPLDVLRNRPDIRRAETQVLSAAGEFELAKADMYPRVTLNGSLSQLDNLTGTTFSGKTIQLTGTPSISIPLFDWGKRLMNAKAQDARLSEAASKYRETVIAAMNEVEEFWSAYRAASTIQKKSADSAALERKIYNQATLLLKQGLIDSIDAENSRINALQAEITHLQTRTESLTRIAGLTKALGGGVPKSVSTKEQAYEP